MIHCIACIRWWTTVRVANLPSCYIHLLYTIWIQRLSNLLYEISIFDAIPYLLHPQAAGGSYHVPVENNVIELTRVILQIGRSRETWVCLPWAYWRGRWWWAFPITQRRKRAGRALSQTLWEYASKDQKQHNRLKWGANHECIQPWHGRVPLLPLRLVNKVAFARSMCDLRLLRPEWLPDKNHGAHCWSCGYSRVNLGPMPFHTHRG